MLKFWQEFDWQIALLVFGSYLIVDILFVYYTYCVVKRRPIRSATTAASMYFLMAIGIMSYVDNPLYLVPLAAGSWIGTYLMVWYESKRAETSEE